jgi:phage terminase small subunit
MKDDDMTPDFSSALSAKQSVRHKKYRMTRPKDAPKAQPGRALTRKQELFVKELVSKDGQITARQAAINAGYAPKSAHAAAHELMNPRYYPNVVRRIREYRQELDEKYGISFERHLRDLQVIRDQALAAGKFSAAVQAEVRRGMAHGNIYVSKSEIRHGSIDSMSKEEVLRAIQELQGAVIDVTPVEAKGKPPLDVLPAGDIDLAEEVDDDAD